MVQHRYLRAYMAGIAMPTLFLLIAMSAFTLARYHYHVSAPVERIIVFPMALVPNLWGAWNMLYVWLSGRRAIPIGLHGALLVVLIVPIGFGVARLVGVEPPGLPPIAIAPILGFAVYYLLWKYVVAFLNRTVGIA